MLEISFQIVDLERDIDSFFSIIESDIQYITHLRNSLGVLLHVCLIFESTTCLE